SPYEDFPQVINKIAAMSGSSNGFVKSLNGSDLYVSSGSAASNANNERIANGATYYATSAWRGLLAEPLFPAGMQGKIDYVEIGFHGAASGNRKMDLTIDFDYNNSTSLVLDDLQTVTAGTQIIYKNNDTSGEPFPIFAVLKPIVAWTAGDGSGDAPVISYIKIFYTNQVINI
ncbi:MAG: hypothetical protein AABY22_32325, partial [Nanoarchaeota archaeon]